MADEGLFGFAIVFDSYTIITPFPKEGSILSCNFIWKTSFGDWEVISSFFIVLGSENDNNMSQSLDVFGKFIIENMFDEGRERYERLLQQSIRSEGAQGLQHRLAKLSEEHQLLTGEIVEDVLTTALHAFLFALQEENDLDQRIDLRVNGENIADVSDGLQGEIFLEDGWIQRFSRYKK